MSIAMKTRMEMSSCEIHRRGREELGGRWSLSTPGYRFRSRQRQSDQIVWRSRPFLITSKRMTREERVLGRRPCTRRQVGTGQTAKRQDLLVSRYYEIPIAYMRSALSMSNLSPLTNGQSAARPRGSKKRPPLPRPASTTVPNSDVEPEHPELGPSTSPDEESDYTSATPDSGSSTPSTEMTGPSMAGFDDSDVSAHFATASVPDEEKLKAIVEEYGDMASLLEGVAGELPEPERILAESKGSLFKWVRLAP